MRFNYVSNALRLQRVFALLPSDLVGIVFMSHHLSL